MLSSTSQAEVSTLSDSGVVFSNSNPLILRDQDTRQRSSLFCSTLLNPSSLVYLHYAVFFSQLNEDKVYWPFLLYYSEMLVVMSSTKSSLSESEATKNNSASSVAPLSAQKSKDVKLSLSRPFYSIPIVLRVKDEWQPQEVYAGNHSRESNVYGTLDYLFCFQVQMSLAHSNILLHNEQEVLLDYLSRRHSFKQIAKKLHLSTTNVQGIYHQSLEKILEYMSD
ncbi:MAG: hypothetical protein WCS37_03235 [Chloroflexota bacterium]|nr:hypothetical protein [Chloroflexota bacterium]